MGRCARYACTGAIEAEGKQIVGGTKPSLIRWLGVPTNKAIGSIAIRLLRGFNVEASQLILVADIEFAIGDDGMGPTRELARLG
jgi:hypothetical protein